MKTTDKHAGGRWMSRIGTLDMFFVLNGLLFVGMCFVRYFDRFVAYRGAGNIAEFFFYAVAIGGAILLLWKRFRHHEIPLHLLAAIQLGILLHFAGGLATVDGARLYDYHFFGYRFECLRFDKFVHLYNTLVVTLLVERLLPRSATGSVVWLLLTVLVVLGLGALVEVVEYIVCLTIPGNGVGSYDNNMLDLAANLCGGCLYLLTRLICPLKSF